MEQSSESIEECPVCAENLLILYQCCPNKEDSLCEPCWSKLIGAEIEKGRTGLLFNGKLTCNYCHEPIQRDHLPKTVQIRLNNILLTIPRTKTPKLIEEFNYSYKDSNHLQHRLTDEKFLFLSQRHYNLLGNCIDSYIQSLMKSNSWNYEELWLPVKDEHTNDHHDQVNIFTSNDFQTNENGCLILIQGSGVVRPGQWARSCCINESLDIGTMFPYMNKAKEHNLSVIILNPNQTTYVDEQLDDTESTANAEMKENTMNKQTSATSEVTENKDVHTGVDQTAITSEVTSNKDTAMIVEQTTTTNTENEEGILPDNELISYYLSSAPLPRSSTKKIPNLSTSREHVLYVYDNIISKCPAKNFYIVAHSAGGDGVMYLLRKRQDNILPNLSKIAFTDSVHSISPLDSTETRNFLKSNAIHFVASDEPMGTPIDYAYDFSQGPTCQEVSAGHPKHEYTSGCCVKGVFDFFFPPNENIDKTIL